MLPRRDLRTQSNPLCASIEFEGTRGKCALFNTASESTLCWCKTGFLMNTDRVWQTGKKTALTAHLLSLSSRRDQRADLIAATLSPAQLVRLSTSSTAVHVHLNVGTKVTVLLNLVHAKVTSYPIDRTGRLVCPSPSRKFCSFNQIFRRCDLVLAATRQNRQMP